MKPSRSFRLLALIAVVSSIAADCSGGEPATMCSGGKKDKVKFQLKWETQAQFAGYYAAKDQG